MTIVNRIAFKLSECKSKRDAQLLWNRCALSVVAASDRYELIANFETYLGQNLLDRSSEFLLDLIIRKHDEKDKAEIALYLTKHDSQLYILIDLVRKCLLDEQYSIWVLQLIGVVSTRIREARTSDETNKLLLSELMANEIIQKIKYVLGDFTCIEKSIYAIQILKNCVEALARIPKVQIVRINEILNMLLFFIHDQEAGETENELRLVTSLELVQVILDADPMVIDFFRKRIKADIGPFVKNKQYTNPTDLQKKLLASCQRVSAVLD